MMRTINPRTEFECVNCQFPNPIELRKCSMCWRDESGKFHPETEPDVYILTLRGPALNA